LHAPMLSQSLWLHQHIAPLRHGVSEGDDIRPHASTAASTGEFSFSAVFDPAASDALQHGEVLTGSALYSFNDAMATPFSHLSSASTGLGLLPPSDFTWVASTQSATDPSLLLPEEGQSSADPPVESSECLGDTEPHGHYAGQDFED
jgi:hypothetical protein